MTSTSGNRQYTGFRMACLTVTAVIILLNILLLKNIDSNLI